MTRTPLIDQRWTSDDGQPSRISLDALLNEDGSVRIDGCDSGPAVKKMMGDWDYEYWATIGTEDTGRACVALMAALFAAKPETKYTDLIKVLEEAGIPLSRGSWR